MERHINRGERVSKSRPKHLNTLVNLIASKASKPERQSALLVCPTEVVHKQRSASATRPPMPLASETSLKMRSLASVYRTDSPALQCIHYS